jgi:acetyltransferase-like isoleucine patch superfamily enzyme
MSLRRSLGRASVTCYRALIDFSAKSFGALAGGAFASFGKGSTIDLPVRLKGERYISIGEGVYVGAGSWLQVLGDSHSEPALVIGDGTEISGSCVLSAAASVRLGRRVLLARNVYVADHSHAFENPAEAVLDQGITDVRPVEIGDGAWLGQNVVVTPGVRIGRGAVIGANSVVRDAVPDYAVAVGAPARVVRQVAGEPEPAP